MSDETKLALSDAPLLERLMAIACGLLVLAVVAFLVVDAFTHPRDGADVELSAGAASRMRGGAYRVELQAHNPGNQSARELEVEAVLSFADGGTSKASLTFEELPAHATRRGAVYFESEPATGRLTLRPVAFLMP